MALQAGFLGPSRAEIDQSNAALLSNVGMGILDWRQRRDQLNEQKRMNDFTQFQRFVGDANLSDLAQTEEGRQVLFKAAGSYLGSNNPEQIMSFLQNLASAPATAEQVAARAQSAYLRGDVVPEEAPAPMTTATPVNYDYDSLFGAAPAATTTQGSQPPARGGAPVRSDAPASPGAQGGTPQYQQAPQMTATPFELTAQLIANYNLQNPDAPINPEYTAQLAAIYAPGNAAQGIPPFLQDTARALTAYRSKAEAQMRPTDYARALPAYENTPRAPQASAIVTGTQNANPRTAAAPTSTTGDSKGQVGARAASAPQGASAGAQGVASASAPAEGEFRAFLFDNPGLVQNPPTSRTWREGLLTDAQLAADARGAYQTFLERRGGGGPAPAVAATPSAATGQLGPTQPVAAQDPTKFSPEQQAGWIAASKTPEGQKQLAARGIRVATQGEIVQWERENVRQAQAGERDVRRWVASKASKNLFDQERAALSAYALNLVQAEGGPEANSFLAPVVTNWADLDRRTKEEQIKLIQAQIGGTYANAQIEWEKAKGAQMQAAADLAAANNEQFKQRIQMVEQGSKLAMPALEAIAKEPDPRRRQAALLSAMKDDPILSSAWSSYLQVTADALDLEPTSLQSVVGVGVGDSFLNFILRRGGWGAEGEKVIVATLPQMVSGSQRQATSADMQAGMDYTLKPAGR